MAVGHLKGVGEVSADVKARALTIQYDSTEVAVEAMQEALLQIGYDSTVLPS